LAVSEGRAALHAFCALGTTIKQAGSQEKFRQIDQTFVLDFGKLCLRLGAKTFSYVSALGADHRSKVFYNRIKGETEAKLKELGFPHLLLHRPSLLLGDRDEFRFGESLAMYAMLPLKWLRIGDSFRGIEASKVARGMLIHAFEKRPASFKIIVSREMHQFTP
ncbi:Rossmann-fold NAD(P)-binding domain-containing protein, partial [Nitritalea halalkaliphila]|uniref:hypothetical protein n=1 Tax=Nitritalea halalkaliphila TaxID=590849 RepID=UPI0005903941